MRREWRKAPQQLRLAGYENPYDYLIDRLWKNYSHHHNQNHGCGKKVREIFLSSCVNDSSTTLAAASSRFYFYPTGENFPPNKSSMKVRWRWKIPLRVGRNFYFQFTKKKKKFSCFLLASFLITKSDCSVRAQQEKLVWTQKKVEALFTRRIVSSHQRFSRL